MGNRRRNIVVAGIGNIGEHLAVVFARRGHDVTVVDVSPERLAAVQSAAEVRVCQGHAASGTVLNQVGIEDADLFVATTGQDAVNVVAALKARSLGAKKTAAVVEEVEYFDDWSGIYRGWLGTDLVLNTRFLVAHEIHKLIRTGGAVAVEDFAENRIEMVQFRVATETPWVERPLNQVPLPTECLVVAIKRGRGLIIPRGDDAIHVGDEVLVIGRTEQVAALGDALGRGPSRRDKTIVLGGGMVGYVLTRTLQGLVSDITLIERDRPRCDFLARELTDVTVLHGDGTSADLLHEEGIETCEVFAAVSGDEERNIIAARLAKELGASRCIALVSRPYYVDVCRHLGLEVVPGPAQIVAREVVRALLPAGVLGATPVMGGVAEFLEILVPAGAPVAGRRLRDAAFPRGSMVCALTEGARLAIPRGDTVIEAGMRAVVFTLDRVRADVERLFRT